MNTTFIAIYEGGVLRPLTPLSLPEHARVQVKIVKSPHKKGIGLRTASVSTRLCWMLA